MLGCCGWLWGVLVVYSRDFWRGGLAGASGAVVVWVVGVPSVVLLRSNGGGCCFVSSTIDDMGVG